MAKHGTSSLELFKIQYLVAGFWCAFVFLFYFVLSFSVRFVCGVALEVRHIHLQGLSRLLLSLLSNGVLIVLLDGSIYLAQRFRVPGFVPSFGFVLSLAAFDFVLQLFLIPKPEPPPELPPWVLLESGHMFWLRGLCVFLGLMFYAFQFSEVVYSQIEFSFGGGLPRSVVFVLNEGTDATSSFLVRDGAGPRTIPYQLLLENENSFVVVSPKAAEKAIEFDRKSVAAMIVLESPKKP